MKRPSLKTDWKDYVMIGLFATAILILGVNYFVGGWFCISFENVELEDQGERCFTSLDELGEYAKNISAKYNSSEYRDAYISDEPFISTSSGDTNKPVDFYSSTRG